MCPELSELVSLGYCSMRAWSRFGSGIPLKNGWVCSRDVITVKAHKLNVRILVALI